MKKRTKNKTDQHRQETQLTGKKSYLLDDKEETLLSNDEGQITTTKSF